VSTGDGHLIASGISLDLSNVVIWRKRVRLLLIRLYFSLIVYVGAVSTSQQSPSGVVFAELLGRGVHTLWIIGISETVPHRGVRHWVRVYRDINGKF
jgi:hypothetical protein